MNMYPGAGQDAQPEVRAAIGRFNALPAQDQLETPLLYWLIGSSTQFYKHAYPVWTPKPD